MNQVIHVITTIERGGAENQLLILVREQCKMGIPVLVVPLKGRPDLHKELLAVGADVNFSCFNRSFTRQILAFKQLRSSSVLIHAHLPRAELLVAISGVKKFIFSRHNTEPYFPGAPKWISIVLSRLVSFRANTGIAISNAVYEFLLSSKEVAAKFPLEVVPYGTAPATELNVIILKDLRSRFNIEPRDFIIGTIARLTPQKDLPTLLKAFSLVLKANPNVKLLIVGDGSEKARLLKLAEELNISRRIIWAGKTSAIIEHLSLMNIFVLSSLYEGFGLVLLEAMSAKIPIVASNNSAIPEVLGINHPGLAQTSHSEDFSTKICLMQNPDFKKLALDLQESRLLHFSSKTMAERIETIYQKSDTYTSAI